MVNLEAGVYGRTGFEPASIMKIGSIEIFQLCRLPPIVAISNGDPELGADINMSAPCPRSRGKRKGAVLELPFLVRDLVALLLKLLDYRLSPH